MFKSKDPFSNKSAEEIKKEQEVLHSIQDKINKVYDSARSCLASTDFQKYRESVRQAREDLITLGKLNRETDPVKYAFFCKAIFSKIDAFDMMVEEIEKDAKRR